MEGQARVKIKQAVPRRECGPLQTKRKSGGTKILRGPLKGMCEGLFSMGKRFEKKKSSGIGGKGGSPARACCRGDSYAGAAAKKGGGSPRRGAQKRAEEHFDHYLTPCVGKGDPS